VHRTLRKLLPDAVGTSQWVVAVNVDIRGFTSYSLSRDSVETALYLKKVYVAIVDGFFQFPGVFYKPTGDGLFFVIPFEEAQFGSVAATALEDAVKLIAGFQVLTANDPMLKFSLPDKLGIGLSAGSASRLSAKGKTLDYSGRVLNQASRLMELARPHGIVFDESMPLDLMPKELVDRFSRDEVYLRGVAEAAPITVYYLRGATQITERSRQPLVEETWATQTETRTVRELRNRSNFRHKLRYRPTDRSRITVEVSHPKYHGSRRLTDVVGLIWPKFTYKVFGDEPSVTIDYQPIVAQLKSKKVREADPVTITIGYPRLKDPPPSTPQFDPSAVLRSLLNLRAPGEAPP
jgi:class 3 adenylate cyclase